MDAQTLIEKLGGTSAVAALCKVKPPSVSEWKAKNHIPDDKLIRLAPVAEEKGICSRRDLFADDAHKIWPDLAPPADFEPAEKVA